MSPQFRTQPGQNRLQVGDIAAGKKPVEDPAVPEIYCAAKSDLLSRHADRGARSPILPTEPDWKPAPAPDWRDMVLGDH
jgi:hypothetical protein